MISRQPHHTPSYRTNDEDMLPVTRAELRVAIDEQNARLDIFGVRVETIEAHVERVVFDREIEVKEAIKTSLRPAVKKAKTDGIARGVGATLASVALILAGGFATHPVEFVDAFSKFLEAAK